MGNQTLIPNTTQVPNVVLDEWLPKLNGSELKVLLVVIRQTIGWVEDIATGRRKEVDWISRGQMMKKTGLGRAVISKSVNALVELGVVEVYSESGQLLADSLARQMEGGHLLYRFRMVAPQRTLFDFQGGGHFLAGLKSGHYKRNCLNKKLNKGSGKVDNLQKLKQLKAEMVIKSL